MLYVGTSKGTLLIIIMLSYSPLLCGLLLEPLQTSYLDIATVWHHQICGSANSRPEAENRTPGASRLPGSGQNLPRYVPQV
jgi:hypothetical protein